MILSQCNKTAQPGTKAVFITICEFQMLQKLETKRLLICFTLYYFSNQNTMSYFKSVTSIDFAVVAPFENVFNHFAQSLFVTIFRFFIQLRS